jgi:hypothetical protein
MAECEQCGATLFRSRSDRRFCDASCRAAHAKQQDRDRLGQDWLDELAELLRAPEARHGLALLARRGGSQGAD